MDILQQFTSINYYPVLILYDLLHFSDYVSIVREDVKSCTTCGKDKIHHRQTILWKFTKMDTSNHLLQQCRAVVNDYNVHINISPQLSTIM